MKYRILPLGIELAFILFWVEDSHGKLHAEGDSHAHGKVVEQRMKNGYARSYLAGPGEQQLPGFVKVKMSSEKGVQIGPHHFRPKKGDLRFSLVKGIPEVLATKGVKNEERFYYEVTERDSGVVKISIIDAVTGELINPQTGKPFELTY